LVQVGDGEPALLIFNEQTLLQRGQADIWFKSETLNQRSSFQ